MNSTPINPIDYKRFMELSKLINKYQNLRSEHEANKTESEITIHTSQNYVSLEIRGFVPKEEQLKIFNDLSLNIVEA